MGDSRPGCEGCTQTGTRRRTAPSCNRSIKSARILLHGVRGNISERRLDPDVHLLDLYHTNPHGEWGSSYRTPPKPLGSKKQPGCRIPAPVGWAYSAWEHRSRP
ncbi:uncharacterized protein LOC132505980 isoform X1 [Lagenorhynchus albirostris]|uniref:uncharacterized protein LOC132505980 isoform X1 n=1 Tax=Lagenorhynchus albirostris TaxID=27610 RepID=UPI0028EED169|nr:uncharacterized protein LOC132505980 isoform X1 [Lagenorhynchus albirostris]